MSGLARRPVRSSDYLWFVACTVIVAIDGFDVAAVAFALPYLPAELFADPVLKGVLLSSGIAGMAVGAIVLSPLADRFGRVALIRLCLVVTVATMALSAAATTGMLLLALRFLTGIAIGGMTASLMVLVQEQAPERTRGFVFGIYSLGFPAGSALGGAVGSLLLDTGAADWRVMFLIGAALGGVGAILSIVWLRATPTPASSAERRSVPLSLLFRERAWVRTLALWGTYGLLMVAYYFISSWTPQLIADATGDTAKGTTVGLVLSIGTFLGSLGFALLSLRFPTRALVGVSMAAGAVAVLILSRALDAGAVTLIAVGVLGIAIYIAITGAGALVTPLYAAEVRATAGGWMVGFGRLCSIASPTLAGALAGRLPPASLFALAAVPLLGGALLTAALRAGRTADAVPTSIDLTTEQP